LLYFRRRVPDDLRHLLDRTEIRLSLGTAYIEEARSKAIQLTAATDRIISFLRNRPNIMELTDQQIRHLVDEWLRKELDDAEQDRLKCMTPYTPVELSNRIETLEEVREFAKSDLVHCSYVRVQDTADEIVRTNGLTVEQDGLSFRRLCRELLIASEQYFSIERHRLSGNYSVNLQHAAAHQNISTCLSPQPITELKPLSQVIDTFLKDKVASGDWSTRSASEGCKLQLLAEILGDPACSSLNADHMRQYKNAIFKLPANFRKNARYRDLPISDVLQLHIPDAKRMKPQTIGNHFEKARTFLTWAKLNGFIADADIKGILKIKKDMQAHEYRAPFSNEDITKLFANETLFAGRFFKPFKFWVPIIGLFSGLRLEEICQLYLDDIKQEDGVWYFWVTDERPDQHLKNMASKRHVPIHPFLLNELNLRGYVQRLRKRRTTRLFPELSKGSNDGRYSDSVSKWFTRYRGKKALVQGDAKGKKVFHSFRTNIGHWCELHDIPEKMAARILGHNYPNITYGRYSVDTSPSLMYEKVFSKLDYGVDLSHLRQAKHVVK